jgi:hypothetical protein
MAATITPESAHDPKRRLNLETVVGQRLWPTPTARDYKGGRTPEALEKSGRGASNSLNDALTVNNQHGQLNPAWVCWLMGYPLDYLDLDGWQNPELEGLPAEYLTEPKS